MIIQEFIETEVIFVVSASLMLLTLILHLYGMFYVCEKHSNTHVFAINNILDERLRYEHAFYSVVILAFMLVFDILLIIDFVDSFEQICVLFILYKIVTYFTKQLFVLFYFYIRKSCDLKKCYGAAIILYFLLITVISLGIFVLKFCDVIDHNNSHMFGDKVFFSTFIGWNVICLSLTFFYCCVCMITL